MCNTFDLFCVKWIPPIDGFVQFTKDYRNITNCPLGGSKIPRYHYTDPTIAKVLSVGLVDNPSSLPQRISLSNFKIGNPITSYGIIYRSTSPIKYLMVKRNNSVNYVDIIRGNYRESQLFWMIRDLPEDERKRLLSYSYDELWYDLYRKPAEGEIYEYGKEVFNKLSPYFEQLFMKIPSVDPMGNNMWLFPKGRPEWKENEITVLIPESPYECSIREFKEETNGIDIIQEKAKLLLSDPIIEKYLGSNSKNYQTNYFVFQTDFPTEIHQHPITQTPIRKISTSEVGLIEWIDLNNLSQYLQPERMEMIHYIEENSNPITYPLDINPIWKTPADMNELVIDNSY